MALKKGVCKNYTQCTIADTEPPVIQEVDSSEFRCSECGKELEEYTGEGKKPFPLKLLLIILSVIILIGGGIWAYFCLNKSSLEPAPVPLKKSVSLSLNKEEISLYVGDNDTLKATIYSQPEDANITVSYTSDNENVALVGNNGVVRAIGQGEASITVIAQMETGIADTALVKVSIYEKTEIINPDVVREQTKPDSPHRNPKVKVFSIGKYEGELKNGIPEGNGKFYYSCRVQIAKHDTDNPPHYAEVGDWFDGTWGNGDIISGALYSKDGRIKEKILAPKRFNSYDLNNDCCQ